MEWRMFTDDPARFFDAVIDDFDRNKETLDGQTTTRLGYGAISEMWLPTRGGHAFHGRQARP